MVTPVSGLPTNRANVADYVVSRIAQDGIDTVFGLTGGGIMYLVDALYRSDRVQLIPVHHEEFAGVAADGYARAGKPYGVAFATTGPGAAHLFTAIAAAWQDSSPVVFIVGQVKSTDSSRLLGLPLRQNGTFEFDTTTAFASISKMVETVASGEEVHEVLERAIALCRKGRPGPVVIELPLDVQGAVVGLGPKDLKTKTTEVPVSTSATIGRAFRDSLESALNRAHRPLFLLGNGVVRAGLQNEFTHLLDRHGIPYVVTQFARGAGTLDHPLFLGSPGIKANRSANIAVSECDLLIAIGTSLHQQVTGWNSDAFKSLPSWKIWCELDIEVLQARQLLVDEAFNLSTESVLRHFSALLHQTQLEQPSNWSDWHHRCRYLRGQALLHFPYHEEVSDRMCLYRAVSIASGFAESFSAVVSDAGITWYALAQHYFPAAGSHYLSSGSFGAMGMALPMAIGAACATHKRVLALTGDGSLMTSLSELATLSQSQLPVVLIINSNDGYLSIKTTHDRYFEGRRIGTDASNGVFIPPILDLARVFDLPFRRARSEHELATVLAEVTDENWRGPVLIELMTYVDQKVEPVVESKRQSDGSFATATLVDMSPQWTDNYVC